jgi:uncharacterized protein (DUF1330 family)
MYKVILDFNSEAVASSFYDRSSFTVVTSYRKKKKKKKNSC